MSVYVSKNATGSAATAALSALRAAIYGRLSAVRPGETSTARQVKDGYEVCEDNGWSVVAEFVDSGRSAWEYSNADREEFERMIEAIEDKLFDILIAWRFDRLTRNLQDYARLYEAARKNRVHILTIEDNPPIDTRQGWSQCDKPYAEARAESERIARRVKRANREYARDGRPHGKRAFGYEPGGLEIREDEADIVREAFRRAEAGESIGAIRRDFNERGLVTTTGSRWTNYTLRYLLMNYRYIGKRHHRPVQHDGWEPEPETVHDSDVIPAIVSVETFEAVHAMIEARKGAKTQPTRRYPFTGVLECGKCGATFGPLTVRGVRKYQCGRGKSQDVSDACKGPTVKAEPVEEVIFGAILDALSNDDIRAGIEAHLGRGDSKRAETLAEIADVNRDLDANRRLRFFHEPKNERINDADYLATHRELMAQLDKLTARLATSPDAALMLGLPRDRDALAAHFEERARDVEYLRRVARCVFARIVVKPSRDPETGAWLVNEERVVLEPRIAW